MANFTVSLHNYVAAADGKVRGTDPHGSFGGSSPTGSGGDYSAYNPYYAASDAVGGGNGSIGSPWTPAEAMANATAGDVVYFRAGTYEVYDPHVPYHAKLEPANSGTDNSNRIVFAAYPTESVTINGNLDIITYPGYDSINVIGNGGKDYITWDGFNLTCNNGLYMAGVMIGGQGLSPYSIGAEILNNVIDGGTYFSTSVDNRDTIRMESTHQTLIANNIIKNTNQVDDWSNTSCIKMYFNTYAVIRNNNFINSTTGPYLKADNYFCEVYDNWVYNCAHGIYGQVYLTRNNDNLSVYNNIVVGSSLIGIGIQQDETATADNMLVRNNTLYNCASGLLLAFGASDTYDNIIMASGTSVTTRDGSTLTTFDHNQYGPTTFNMDIGLYGSSANYALLAAWQASGELSAGGNPGVGSLTSDPLFVNGSGLFNSIADFALNAGSPCINADRAGTGNMGADPSTVGVQ